MLVTMNEILRSDAKSAGVKGRVMNYQSTRPNRALCAPYEAIIREWMWTNVATKRTYPFAPETILGESKKLNMNEFTKCKGRLDYINIVRCE